MTNQPNFRRVGSVAVPVSDQDRAKAFFLGLGFEERLDVAPRGGFRWIELGPPDGGAGVALVAAGDELPTGIDTGIRFVVADAKAARDEVAAAGATPSDLVDWPGVPLMFSFADVDGNRLYVVEE
jgi:predicted enzyme related to lactoylglutathione lyase